MDFTGHALDSSLCFAFTTVWLCEVFLSRSFQLGSVQASPLCRTSGDVGWKRFVSSCLRKSVSWHRACVDGGVGLAGRTSKARAQGRIASVPGSTFSYVFISSIHFTHLCAPSWGTDDGHGPRELCAVSDACQVCGSTGAAQAFWKRLRSGPEELEFTGQL